MTGDGGLYELVLGAGATERGEQIVCEVLASACQVAKVRVVQSNVPFYRAGQTGTVPVARLVRLGDCAPA